MWNLIYQYKLTRGNYANFVNIGWNLNYMTRKHLMTPFLLKLRR